MNWTEAQRAEALVLAADHGHAEAARRTGVPCSTIRSWARRETERALVLVGADVVSPSAPWGRRREAIMPALADAASEALDATRKALKADKLRDAQSGAVAFGILVDKAQLLAGLATSRTESATVHVRRDDREMAAEIAALRAELEL